MAIACVLIAGFAVPQGALAQEHVVSPSDLQRQAVAAAKARQEKLQKVQNFFATDRAKKALQSARIDGRQVQNAVAQLSDQELTQLAAKTGAAQQDFAAGALTNQEITYIIIALAAAVLVLIIVKA
jgi:hypothetical protein